MVIDEFFLVDTEIFDRDHDFFPVFFFLHCLYARTYVSLPWDESQSYPPQTALKRTQTESVLALQKQGKRNKESDHSGTQTSGGSNVTGPTNSCWQNDKH